MSEPEPPSGSLESLTPREREVIGLAAAHLRTRDIAERLGLSPETVDEHIGRAVRKLGAADRASAIRLYLAIGGAQAPPVPGPPRPAREGTRPHPLMVVARTAGFIVAGVIGLIALQAGLARAVTAWPDLTAIARLLSGLGPEIMLLGFAAGWAAGREGERLAVCVALTAWAATLEAAGWSPMYSLIVIDGLAAMGLALIAHGYRRRGLGASAVAMLLSAMSHVAALAVGPTAPVVYLTVVYALGYAVLGLILWSALEGGQARAGPVSPPS